MASPLLAGTLFVHPAIWLGVAGLGLHRLGLGTFHGLSPWLNWYYTLF